MRRVLLTGMSGTGKSSLVAALIDRGYCAIDTDDGWMIPQPDGTQVWDVEKLTELLDHTDRDVIVAGCEENMTLLVGRFDAIVLLTAPPATLIERLDSRTGNPFGKSPEEQAKVLRDQAEVEPLLRRIAHVEIDTRLPFDEVLGKVLDVVEG